MSLNFTNRTRFIECFVIFLSLCFHLLSVQLATGYHHYDEHFQILEFSTIKLSFASSDQSSLPWEFKEKIRSSLQPYIVVFVANILNFFDLYSPFVCNYLLRLSSSLFAFFVSLLWAREAITLFSNRISQISFIIFNFLLWYYPYIDSRFSSENFAGIFLLLAITLFYKLLRRKSKAAYFMLVGICLGFSFLFRFQMGICILGFTLWYIFLQRKSIKKFIYIAVGLILSISFGTACDYFFYGDFVITFWNYFRSNIIYGVAAKYGVSPWWSYFTNLYSEAIAPIALLIIVSIVYYIYSKPLSLISWIILPFLFVHSIIGHKELRFLFPIAHLVTIPMIYFFHKISNKWLTITSQAYILSLFVITNAAICIIALRYPKNEVIPFYKFVWKKYGASNSNTYLIYQKINPYKDADLDVNFYKPANLRVLDLYSLPPNYLYEEIITEYNNCLLVSHMKIESDSEARSLQLVYKDKFFFLYEIKPRRK